MRGLFAFIFMVPCCVVFAAPAQKKVAIISGAFKFEAKLKLVEGLQDTYEIEGITVTDTKSKQVLQTLGQVGDTVAENENPLAAIDKNKDGYPDLQVSTVCGNKRCEVEVFLFDPQTKKFARSAK